MRINCFVHPRCLTHNPSGVGRVVDQVVRHHQILFPDVPWRFIVNAAEFSKCEKDFPAFWRNQHYIAFDGNRRLQELRWIFQNSSSISNSFNSNDIVYSASETFFPKGKGKSVFSVNDLAHFENDLYPLSKSWKRRVGWSLMFERMARSADAIIAISEFTASRIRNYFPKLGGKIHVVPLAAHPSFFQEPSLESARRIKYLTEGKPFVFKPGGMNFKKNIGLVLRAWPLVVQQVPDARLIVNGIYYEDKLGISEAKSILGDSLIAIDYVSDDMLNSLYRGSHAVWVPSRYEGFGMPAVEALASGKTVVVSDAGSLPEVVGDAAVVCGRDDENAHSDALIAILRGGQTDDQSVAGALARAKSFSWTRTASELNTIFRNMLDCS